jgi:hypothetical protein
MTGILMMSVGNSYGSLPVNTVAPVVSGTATVGQTLTTTNGTWLGAPAPTFTYQWQRAGSNIGGATSSTYLLVVADVGNAIRCVVTATNPLGVASANSNATSAVAATVPGAPTIGTATKTGSTTATVAFTAPASNGGATITSYAVTSSPAGGTGTLNQAGSGTISVTGLTGGTSYTFTVRATNSAGQGPASGSSNSITTDLVIGQAYAGGFYAGQISTTANSVATHNLVIGPKATAEASSTLRWMNNPIGNISGTNSRISGPSNSASMYSQSPAAQFCEDLTVGGFSDWYLPALDEIQVVYVSLKPLANGNHPNSGINDYSVPKQTQTYSEQGGGPSQTSAVAFRRFGSEAISDSYYWTSTQDPASYLTQYAWGCQFYSGFTGTGQKNNTFRVRAIRRVAV